MLVPELRGRVTVASEETSNSSPANQPAVAGAPTPSQPQPTQSDQDKIISPVWKGCRDMFTMDYRNPPFSSPGFRHMPEQLRHQARFVNSGSVISWLLKDVSAAIGARGRVKWCAWGHDSADNMAVVHSTGANCGCFVQLQKIYAAFWLYINLLLMDLRSSPSGPHKGSNEQD
ncbi:hypothetical protein HPP92_006581 [Vanilla planifolia]|uniref:Uncharacterized protein n=1 Tax=Vanilla planifolia TaxID=51239 RepID=A0A835RFW5_VANPL|nr:hypothetical protein HPP92_006581 [Vanilla planifolia]